MAICLKCNAENSSYMVDTLAVLNQLDFFDADMVIMLAKSIALDIKYDYIL